MSVANSILEKFENYQHPVFQKEILIQRGIWKKACKSFHAKNHQISRNNCKVVIHYICSMYIVHLHTQEACSTTAVQEFENDKAKAGIASGLPERLGTWGAGEHKVYQYKSKQNCSSACSSARSNLSKPNNN